MSPVKDVTWDEVIKRTPKGEIDVLPAAMKSEKRSKYLNFSKLHTLFPMVVLMREDATYVKGVEDLQDQKVATIKGYITEELLLKDFSQFDYHRFDTIEEALLALSQGEVDAFICNTASISYSSQKLGLDNLHVAAPPDYRFELAYYVEILRIDYVY